MTAKTSLLPSPSVPWVDGDGRPTQAFIQFMTRFAKGDVGPLPSAANDAAANAAGIGVGYLYENNGAVRIRKI